MILRLTQAQDDLQKAELAKMMTKYTTYKKFKIIQLSHLQIPIFEQVLCKNKWFTCTCRFFKSLA